jgi:deoxyribodipyrimidine photo-lyase
VIEPERLRDRNDAPERPAGSYVLYWMQQSQRARFNPALETAVAIANRLGLPVQVGFGLTDSYPQANARHYTFMLQGLAEVEAALHRRGIGFELRLGAPERVAIDLAAKAAVVVCDRGYLRHQKAWRDTIATTVGCRVVEVEGDAVVPVARASEKGEFAARTIRPKILRHRDDFLKPLRAHKVEVSADRLHRARSVDLSDIAKLVSRLAIDHAVGPSARFTGGTTEALRRLRRFIAHALDDYAQSRSEPAKEQVSFLAAYLHFGQISPVEIALAVRDAAGERPDRAAYLEELIVRRELAINFVEYEPAYDSYETIPEWARLTLDRHRNDKRPHLYGMQELEAASTADPYWNAAMREMTATGYMHNHMRMYWGKKILEWSKRPEQAFTTALALNNRYFLCGRDPSSYANVAWCFGLHDRPWPERPVFGTVRSMTASGLERKTDIDAYVRRVDELVASAG